MKEKKTLLIFGISSFVGSNLAHLLKNEYRIIGTYFNTPVMVDNILTFKCDILKKNEVLNLMRIFKPELTLYCVGLTGFSDALSSPALSEALNTSGVFNVTSGAERCRSKLIFLSSHFVYSGEKILFRKNEMPMPCTKYGNDLASSEFYIQRTCLNYLIFRCPPILGKSFNSKENKFLEILEYNGKLAREIECDDDIQHGYITVQLLAQVIHKSIQMHLTNELLLIGSRDICSRYEFAKKYLLAKGFKIDNLEKKKWIFPRTENKVALKDLGDKLSFAVDVSESEKELSISMPSIDQIIRDLLSKRKNSKFLGTKIDFI